MAIRIRVALATLWLLSLLTVGAFAWNQGAQAYQLMPLPEPIVLTGDDLAFRVEGTMGAAPAGGIVIRWNGEWVEPRSVPRTLRPAE